MPAIAGADANSVWQPVGLMPDGSVVTRVLHADPQNPGNRRFTSLIETPTGFEILRDRSGGDSRETIAKVVDSSGRIHGFVVNPQIEMTDNIVIWAGNAPAQRQTEAWNIDVSFLFEGAAPGGYLVGYEYDGLTSRPPAIFRNDQRLTWDAQGAATPGFGYAVNSLGEATGYSWLSGFGAYVWSPTHSREYRLPEIPTGFYGMGFDIGGINDAGWVVVSVSYQSESASLWGTLLMRPDGAVLVNGLGASPSLDAPRPTIDNLGTILAHDAMGTLLFRDEVLYRTTDLSLPGFTGQLLSIDRLELDGRCIGQAIVNGERVAVVLTPVPTPGGAVLSLIAFGAVGRRRRRDFHVLPKLSTL